VLTCDRVPIASQRPETGVRIQLERDPNVKAAPYFYRGAATTPNARFDAEVTVHEDGRVDVALEGAAAELVEKVRLIVRTVVRQAEGEAPAWRIVRWRGEK
jgi:hypothetical protein